RNRTSVCQLVAVAGGRPHVHRGAGYRTRGRPARVRRRRGKIATDSPRSNRRSPAAVGVRHARRAGRPDDRRRIARPDRLSAQMPLKETVMEQKTAGNSFDVIVVGVGAVGSATCYYLAKRGLRVLGLERFAIPHAQGGSHGFSRQTKIAPYIGGP